MSAKVTSGIEVSVKTRYDEVYSDPSSENFAFTYIIRISNHNSFPVRLLRRHWFIVDASYEHKQVQGDGVVGQQPVIGRGEDHEYFSACHLKSEFGKMYGFYTMENIETGEEFQVSIPEFTLTAPVRLN